MLWILALYKFYIILLTMSIYFQSCKSTSKYFILMPPRLGPALWRTKWLKLWSSITVTSFSVRHCCLENSAHEYLSCTLSGSQSVLEYSAHEYISCTPSGSQSVLEYSAHEYLSCTLIWQPISAGVLSSWIFIMHIIGQPISALIQ